MALTRQPRITGSVWMLASAALAAEIGLSWPELRGAATDMDARAVKVFTPPIQPPIEPGPPPPEETTPPEPPVKPTQPEAPATQVIPKPAPARELSDSRHTVEPPPHEPPRNEPAVVICGTQQNNEATPAAAADKSTQPTLDPPRDHLRHQAPTRAPARTATTSSAAIGSDAYLPPQQQPQPPRPQNIEVEAEDPTRHKGYQSGKHSSASGGAYVLTHDLSRSDQKPGPAFLEYSLTVELTGKYTASVRALARDEDACFWVKLDDADPQLARLPTDRTWKWSDVPVAANDAATVELSAGKHSLKIGHCASDVLLDVFMLKADESSVERAGGPN